MVKNQVQGENMNKIKKLHCVGFEPTQPKLAGQKMPKNAKKCKKMQKNEKHELFAQNWYESNRLLQGVRCIKNAAK